MLLQSLVPLPSLADEEGISSPLAASRGRNWFDWHKGKETLNNVTPMLRSNLQMPPNGIAEPGSLVLVHLGLLSSSEVVGHQIDFMQKPASLSGLHWFSCTWSVSASGWSGLIPGTDKWRLVSVQSRESRLSSKTVPLATGSNTSQLNVSPFVFSAV